MSRKKKKLKLSPAMKMGMMLILLEGKKLVYATLISKRKWWISSPYLDMDKVLFNGRRISDKVSTCTISALERRGLVKGNQRRFAPEYNNHAANGVYLTKQGLHRIKQWPEYEEIIAIKVLNDL